MGVSLRMGTYIVMFATYRKHLLKIVKVLKNIDGNLKNCYIENKLKNNPEDNNLQFKSLK